MIQRMCRACGVCGCEGNPCKPSRARTKASVAHTKGAKATTKLTLSERAISEYPLHIQEQLRAKLAQ